MKLKDLFNKHKLLIAAVLVAVICSYPFILAAYRHSYITGDDIQTHMQRIEGMLSSYRAGHIPARLHLSTLRGYAYGMGFFYPQLLLVIPVVLRLLGMNFILSTNAFLVIVNILTVLSVYFCIHKITGSAVSAFSGAILSLLSYYRLADIFYRGSLGETAAYIFTPLLILGLYELFHHKPSGTVWAVIGFSGILCTHLLSFVLSAAVVLLFLAVMIPFRINDNRIRKQLFITLLLSLLITAGFWMPFLEQYLNVDIFVKSGYDSPYRPAVSASAALRIICCWWRTIPSYLYDPLILTLPVILFSFFIGSRKNAAAKAVLAVIGSFGFFLSTNLFCWNNFEVLHRFIQFPWRFMFLPTAVFPIAFGLALESLKFRKLQVFLSLLMFAACIFFSAPVLDHVINNYIMLSPGYHGIQDGVGAGEYLPTGAAVEHIQKQGRNIIGPVENLNYKYNEKGLTADLQYQTDRSMAIELPFLYYKGWMYRLNDEKPIETKHGQHGLVSIDLTPSDDGVVKIYYQKTMIQWAADFLTLLGLAGLFISAGKERK